MKQHYSCWALIPLDDSEPFTGDIQEDGTVGGWRVLAFKTRAEARAAKKKGVFSCRVVMADLMVIS